MKRYRKKTKKNQTKIVAKSAPVTITSLGGRGDGIGDFEGNPVYIGGTLEGESITAEISKSPDGTLRGRLIDVTDPSPSRTHPACHHAQKCGGCSLQHMEQSFYQTWKENHIKTAFKKAGFTPEFLPSIFIEAGTRRRCNLTITNQNGAITLGYKQQRSHNIISIKQCPVLAPALWQEAQNMKPFLQAILPPNKPANLFLQMSDSGLDVVITGQIGTKDEPDLNCLENLGEMLRSCDIARISWRKGERDEPELLLEKHPLRHNFDALSINLPSMAFLQPSKEGEDALGTSVMNYINDAFPDNTDASALKLADLFSGCGAFSGRLLKRGKVDAFEIEEGSFSALAAARDAAALHELTAKKRDLFSDPLAPMEVDTYDCIVMDPPRAGALEQSKEIAQSGSLSHLIYVSCNPSTFIRDARILTEDGDFTLEKVQIVDQFIWSEHTEIIAYFTTDDSW